MAEADRLAAAPLWPGFDPRRVPVAIDDGESTWLFRHPGPPSEVVPSGDRPDVWTFADRHPSVYANSAVELGGTPAATVMMDLDRDHRAPVTDLAALVVHEAFDVFQAERHPGWGGDEGELFLYPAEDTEALALSRLETEALRRALAEDRPNRAERWAATATTLRQERFGKLPEAAVA